MNNNLIIECRQKNASKVYNNGDFNTKTPSFKLYEGDELTLNKVFIDTEAQNDTQINILEDVNLFLDVFVYNFNYFIGSSGSPATNDMTFDEGGYMNDGYEYIMASQTQQYEPINKLYKLYTQFQVKPKDSTAPGDKWGKNASLGLFYIDIDGNKATMYMTAGTDTYYPQDPDDDTITINTSVYAKIGGMGSAGISGADNSFIVSNPSIWNAASVNLDGIVSTASGTIQHDILTPRIFTKEIKLLAGKYNPNDLTTEINNKLTENSNIQQQGFNQNTVIENAFLQESINNKRTEESFNVIVYVAILNNNSTTVKFLYQSNKIYIDGQTITFNNLPNQNFHGINLSQFNGTQTVANAINNITVLGNSITLTSTTQATATENFYLGVPIYDLVFYPNATGTIIDVYYDYDNDITGADGILTEGTNLYVITNKNTIFAGINTTTHIDEVAHSISSSIFDIANKRGSFKITISQIATGTGTLSFRNPLDNNISDGLGVISLISTNKGNITNTENSSDYRFLTRYDGERIKQYSKTFGSDTQDGNYWLGSSQMEIAYDAPTDRFKWLFNHQPIYTSGQAEAIGIIKDAQTSPVNPNPYYYAGRNGGVIFHNLRAELDKDSSISDFWTSKLGFDISKICLDFKMEIKVLGTGNQHIPVFQKPILGQHITSARPDIDSLINKASSFSSVPSLDTYPLIATELTTEIIADNITIDNNAWRFGYFYIEVQGFNTELLAEDGNNGIEIRNNLIGVISNYYSLGGYTTSEGGGAIYKHIGEPMLINNLRVRILTSDKLLDSKLGSDNTIFFSITRGQMSQAIDANFKS